MLISANDADTEDAATGVNLHHNWFKQTTQRHPCIRHGKLHAYNNFIDRWQSYGMGCSTNSECYSERNVFQADFYAYTADSTTGLAEVIQAGAGVR